MTRPARAAERAAAVINFMSLRPQRTFTLTELSAALRITPSSLTDVLLALTQTGYLLRHETRKTYELGPALVAIGLAAAARHPVVELARPVMDELAALGEECVGTARAGADMINLAVAAAPNAVPQDWRVGKRVPIMRPYGQLFTSWMNATALSRWLGREEIQRLQDDAWRDQVHENRTRGFVVTLNGPDVAASQRAIEEIQMNPGTVDTNARLRELVPALSIEAYSLGRIDPATRYPINYIGAPIFDRFGGVVYSLSVFGLGTISGERVAQLGELIRDRCWSVTRQLGGHPPELDAALP